MTIKAHFEHQMLSKLKPGASKREIKAVHDMKWWLTHVWALRERAKLQTRRLHVKK